MVFARLKVVSLVSSLLFWEAGCSDHFNVAPPGSLAQGGSGALGAGGDSAAGGTKGDPGNDSTGGMSSQDLEDAYCAPSDPYCVVTLAGSGIESGFLEGLAENARFTQARGAVVHQGKLYVTHEHAVFVVDQQTRESSLFVGASEAGKVDGVGSAARLNQPSGIVAHLGYLYVADTGNRRIVRINVSTAEVSTYLTTLVSAPTGLLLKPSQSSDTQYLLIADEVLHIVLQVGLLETAPTPGVLVGTKGVAGNNSVTLNQPHGLATLGETLYITERGNHIVRSVDLTKAPPLSLSLVWGSGSAGSAEGVGAMAGLNAPRGIVAYAGALFVADSGNFLLRRGVPGQDLKAVAGKVLESGGADGPGKEARFLSPGLLLIDQDALFVPDGFSLRRVRL